MPKLNEVKHWQERIQDGQRFQLKFAGMQEWARYKNYYRHRNFVKGVIPVNLMFSILRSLVPQVYFRNPRVSITARKPGMEAELVARIIQKLDNWLLGELATKREFKRLIADNFFCGLGNGIIGYDSAYGLDSKTLDPTGQYSVTQFDKAGNRIEFNSTVNPGMPWFLRARPEDVVFPWATTNTENLEWFALRVFRKLRDLKKDKKYSNTKDVKGTFTPRRTTPEGGLITDINDLNETSTDEQWIELWEIHDARKGEVLGLVFDHDALLRKDTDNLAIEGLPVETICFNPDPDYIYGIPDARVIEPQLLELIDIRTQSMKHRRVNILKGLIRKNSMSDEEIAKLTNEDVQALVQVESDAPSLNDVYTPVNTGVSGILQDLIAQGELTRSDVRETVGFSRTAQGEFMGKTHISAEETKRVFQSLNIRLDERRDEMADLVSRVVRKWNQLIFTHWTSEQVTQIVGPDGAQWWVKFTGPQIKNEYDLKVEIEESAAIDTNAKKQMGMQAAEIWAKLNAGAVSQGAPVPAEIQRLIFAQFESSGLDVDKLVAQSQGGAQQGPGSSPNSPISPGMLAAIQESRRQ